MLRCCDVVHICILVNQFITILNCNYTIYASSLMKSSYKTCLSTMDFSFRGLTTWVSKLLMKCKVKSPDEKKFKVLRCRCFIWPKMWNLKKYKIFQSPCPVLSHNIQWVTIWITLIYIKQYFWYCRKIYIWPREKQIL